MLPLTPLAPSLTWLACRFLPALAVDCEAMAASSAADLVDSIEEAPLNLEAVIGFNGEEEDLVLCVGCIGNSLTGPSRVIPASSWCT